MNDTRTTIPNEHPIYRTLAVGLLSASRAFFWLGIVWFGFGEIITFVPGGEQSWFTIAGVFTAFGFFIPQQRYRIAALVFVALSTFAAFDGHKRGIKYRQHLEPRRAAIPIELHAS